MGKPAATDRPRLPSLSHSFTLDFVVLCSGTKAEAQAMKEELRGLLSTKGLTLSEEKTKITHITEGFNFLGYRIIREIGTSGMMVPKVEIPEGAIKKFRYKVRRITAPGTSNESVNAKIKALNDLTRGWCQYYCITSSPQIIFGKLRPEVFWGMAHWLGRKYKGNMPRILQKYRQGETLGTKTGKLVMPTEYKARKRLVKVWNNPYTDQEKVREEKDRIRRESIFSYDKLWNGEEIRPGHWDFREEAIAHYAHICVMCKKKLHPSEIQVDHKISRIRFKNPAEANTLENAQLLCTECHRAKTKADLKVLSRMR